MDKHIETTSMGTRRHSYIGKKADLRVELHYCDLNDGNERQACLYLYHFLKPKGGVLVPFTGMWQFAERNRIEQVVRPIAKQLFGFVTQQDEHKVLDAMLDYMEDLKNHKPEPGLDKSLDEFLEECENEGNDFFFEVGGQKVIG